MNGLSDLHIEVQDERERYWQELWIGPGGPAPPSRRGSRADPPFAVRNRPGSGQVSAVCPAPNHLLALGSERANMKKERQALPAAVLRVLYRAVRHGRLAQCLDNEAGLLEGVEVRCERAMLTLEAHV